MSGNEQDGKYKCPVRKEIITEPRSKDVKIAAGDSVTATVKESKNSRGEVIETDKKYTFTAGDSRYEIRGLSEGVVGMYLGERSKLFCPPGYGYKSLFFCVVCENVLLRKTPKKSGKEEKIKKKEEEKAHELETDDGSNNKKSVKNTDDMDLEESEDEKKGSGDVEDEQRQDDDGDDDDDEIVFDIFIGSVERLSSTQCCCEILNSFGAGLKELNEICPIVQFIFLTNQILIGKFIAKK
ncbi:hypothetical protein RFI_36651 [Reticulomyxa filosa]|uniref:peptidylprolyl isomerase n=1 Tax=Reticulomyxa filosa TaxID=46433 RepID=X6LI22_RETFI|nr:hypothetical protein RFI_36651 [Reticulomyxa filosa]|eukprot:ETO00787.1 hypothetical protein RFI_36651 [Reticulomyxa filosa]